MNTHDLQQGSDLHRHLADHDLIRHEGFIGGCWTETPTDRRFAVTDPATDVDLLHVADLGAAETDAAIDAAAHALGSWRSLTPDARAAYLRNWHRLILQARRDLALIMTLEQGKPLREALDEIDYAASFVEWYAEEGRRLNIEGVTSHLSGAEMFVSRRAVGVAGLLTPWNFPSAMVTRKAAAALAAGCSVVLHPSPHTPLSALALVELAARAGLPPGVLNVVPGRDAAAIAGALCKDQRVRAISFTGSTAIGRQLARDCAASLKHMVMELGGNAPLIIFADVELNRAVDIAIATKFATSGQDCLAANRIFVERPIYPRFCEAFAERVMQLKVGHGLDPHTDIGPLMHERAVAATRERVEEARALGARELTSSRPAPGPLFVMPSVFADVPDHAALMREESFAPVAALTPFTSEDEVITRANATDYGLVAYVVAQDLGRALRLNRALEYGMVAINRAKLTGPPVPFGGMKQSGLGREGSRLGIEAFTDIKYTCVDLT